MVTLQNVDSNIKQEYDQIDAIKDEEQKKDFYEKVKALQKKVPLLAQVYKKLDIDTLDIKTQFKALSHDLAMIKDKDII